ncbi:MAG: DUF1836 domain-containing protein [Lachnospiraceae bacterium]|nr:DUF1836 domain-containing protein [Lachnospiraceae bacterium]
MNTNTFNDIKEKITEWIRLDYIYPEDIPTIELYMDQVTTFMDKQLSGNKRHDEDKILTKTMINNYSKNDLLPPSDKKKYSKDHIILLIYIYYMKNFLSINDIERLLKPMTETHFQTSSEITMSDIYADIFSLEQQYGVKVRESINDVYEIAATQFATNDDYLKTFAMISMLSYDIYAKKQLVEKMVDSLLEKPISKAEQKEAAKAESKEAKALARQQEKEAKAKKNGTASQN